jgi:hypothetical protein
VPQSDRELAGRFVQIFSVLTVDLRDCGIIMLGSTISCSAASTTGEHVAVRISAVESWSERGTV